MNWRDPRQVLACGLGSGLSPRAPGTAGTALAVPLYLLLAGLEPTTYLLLVAALFALGVWLCAGAARALGAKDPGCIVFDEIVGYLATMAAAPPGWLAVVVGFLLFRLFDVLKPWPVSAADRGVGGGLGIMLDDLLAAGYAWLALHALWWLAEGLQLYSPG